MWHFFRSVMEKLIALMDLTNEIVMTPLIYLLTLRSGVLQLAQNRISTSTIIVGLPKLKLIGYSSSIVLMATVLYHWSYQEDLIEGYTSDWAAITALVWTKYEKLKKIVLNTQKFILIKNVYFHKVASGSKQVKTLCTFLLVSWPTQGLDCPRLILSFVAPFGRMDFPLKSSIAFFSSPPHSS